MDLKELYRDVILDHNKRPRNFGKLEAADAHADGHNPLCGDRLTVFLKMDGNRVEDIRFEGKGCAISTASASMMTEAIKGKDKADIGDLFGKMHSLLTQQDAVADPAPGQVGSLVRRAGVPCPRQMRELVLAHIERGARQGRGHGVDGVSHAYS